MMKCGKCGKCHKCAKLGPISLGLGLGVTSGLAVLIWSFWAMFHGVTPMMAQFHIPVPTVNGAIIHSLITLVKGFVFGFFLALFYDLFASLLSKCCKKSDGSCTCGESTEAEKK